jgi:6-phosphogluconolactonase
MSDWHNFPDTGQLDRELAQYIAGQLAADIDRYGQASLAVSGGSTPQHMFQLLSRCQLDWSQVHITLVDERWVAPDSPESNERLVRQNLLQNRAANAVFIGLKSADQDAACGLAGVLEKLAALPQPFAAVVLGMGSDGHTASWFPQAANLDSLLDPGGTEQLAVTDPVTAAHQRITLTLPAVLNSRGIIIHITGDEKKLVIASARHQHHPIAAILAQNTTPATIWWAP